LAAAAKKADISKSMSSDMAGRLRSLSDWRTGAAGPVPSLEMGCLNSYGMGARAAGPWNTPSPPTAAAFSAHVPPPLTGVSSSGNSHPPLERQLTINPTFDPRINKPRKSQQLLCSAAMEYMHRNPPPPLGSMPQQPAGPPPSHHHLRQLPEQHQNVTRIASAPESIRLWGAAAAVNSGTATAATGSSACSLPVAIVEPLGMDLLAGVASCSRRTPIQRSHNSTSDSQLNRSSPTAGGDPFSSETWKYDSGTGISPILSASPVGSSGSLNGGGSAAGNNIWGPPPPAPTTAAGEGSALTPPQRESPPPSPLGPVGSSRPSRIQQQDTRQQLKYHLSALFPVDQVTTFFSASRSVFLAPELLFKVRICPHLK